jgi:hypothetical protein
LVEEQPAGLIERQGFLDAVVDEITLKAEEAIGPLDEQRRGLDRRLCDIHGQTARNIEVWGRHRSASLPSVEVKVKALQAGEPRIVRRGDELTL